MNREQKVAFDAVQKINDGLCDKYINDLDNRPIVSLTIADYYMMISISLPDEFGGQEIHLYSQA